MGIPSAWHRRQALMIASQLPEDQDDARMVIKAITELMDTFLAHESKDHRLRSANVLPFSG